MVGRALTPPPTVRRHTVPPLAAFNASSSWFSRPAISQPAVHSSGADTGASSLASHRTSPVSASNASSPSGVGAWSRSAPAAGAPTTARSTCHSSEPSTRLTAATRPSKSAAKSRSPDATGGAAAGAGRVAVHRGATGSQVEGGPGGASGVPVWNWAAAAPGSMETARRTAGTHPTENLIIGRLQDMVVSHGPMPL